MKASQPTPPEGGGGDIPGNPEKSKGPRVEHGIVDDSSVPGGRGQGSEGKGDQDSGSYLERRAPGQEGPSGEVT